MTQDPAIQREDQEARGSGTGKRSVASREVALTPRARSPPIRARGSHGHVALLVGGHAHRLLSHGVPVKLLAGGEPVLGLGLHELLRGNVWVLSTWGRRESHVEPVRRGRRASHVGYLRGRGSDSVAIDVLVCRLHRDWLAGDYRL